MANQEQITVRFESTLDNELAEDNSLLLSGPIKVQLVLDEFSELTSPDCVEELIELENSGESFIIAYVKNVAGYLDLLNSEEEEKKYIDSILNRGAYFYLSGWVDENKTQPIWNEILLGTHSHPNLDRLNKFVSRLDEDGKIVETEESISENEIVLQLPKLPPEIYNRLMEHKVAIKLKGGLGVEASASDTDDEHLHVLGDDYYDWCAPDEAGRYANLDVVSHNELYRRLHRDSVALKLHEIDESLPNDSVQLIEYALNYNVAEEKAGYINASEQGNELYFKVRLPWPVGTSDKLFLLKDVNTEEYKLLEEKVDYNIVSLKNRDLTVSVKKQAAMQELGTITILKIENPSKTPAEYLNLLNEDLIERINTGLRIRYIEGAVESKFELPKLYLSTDKDGNLEWTNALLPAQYFLFREQRFTAEEITAMHSDVLEVRFIDTNYNANTDFPLLLVNSSFIFNAQYEIEVVDREKHSFNLICRIPMTNENIVERGYDEIGADVKLILIRKTSAEAIADTVAENYISKKDAINILSRGKLDLKDYVTREELNNFARKIHSHTEYSLRGHNHDFRYANYQHTHPEIAALLTQLLRNPDETPEEQEARYRSYLNEISTGETDRLMNFINNELNLYKDNSTGLYSITDRNVKLSSEAINLFNTFIAEDLNATDERKLELSLGNDAYLRDALNTILEIFKEDGVDTSQVFLDRAIPVKVPIGGIKAGTLYDKGTKIQKILEDILNPYVSEQEMVTFLTPDITKTKVRWFKGVNKEEILDTANIRYESERNSLWYKIELYNKEDKRCKSEYTVTNDPRDPDYGQTIDQIVMPVVDGNEPDSEGYFLYSNNYSFQNSSFVSFSYTWKIKNDKVFDNYGINDERFVFTGNAIDVDEFLKIQLPDFLYGKYESSQVPMDVDRSNGKLEFPNEKGQIFVSSFEGKAGDKLVVLLEADEHDKDEDYDISEDLVILDVNNHMEIQDYFASDSNNVIKLFDGTKSYRMYYYTLGADTDEIKLLIKLRDEKEKEYN